MMETIGEIRAERVSKQKVKDGTKTCRIGYDPAKAAELKSIIYGLAKQKARYE